jgi:YHS domain-containing protein
MKAVTWQRWISIAVGLLALTIALQPAFAAKPSLAPNPGLPIGLPELPHPSELMQSDQRSGLALNGYDPVAYQLLGRATPGRPDYELTYRGTVWRFASAANREAFRDAPTIYEPAFAGFDPMGVVDGRAVETDPRQFAVIGSRLFLFRTPEARNSFVGDASLLQSALAQWQNVYETIAR